MALFQPFKAATQRKGSAVQDEIELANAKTLAAQVKNQMMAQNLQGATSIAKWGLGKDTSPWADSLYGEEAAAPTENAMSTALRADGPLQGLATAPEGYMSGAVTPAAEAGVLENALATAPEGFMSGAVAPAAEAGLLEGALATAPEGVMSGLGTTAATTAVPAATTAATTGAAGAGAAGTGALAAMGPIGMGIGGLLLARQLGVFG